MRFQSDLRFIENFKNVFNVTLLEEIPQEEVRIYQATARKWAQMREKEKGEKQQHDVNSKKCVKYGRLYIKKLGQQPQYLMEGAPPVGHLRSYSDWQLNATIPYNNANNQDLKKGDEKWIHVWFCVFIENYRRLLFISGKKSFFAMSYFLLWSHYTIS